MNIYGVIALVFAIIIFAHVFNSVEPISQFIRNITDIPVFGTELGDRPLIFKFAVRLAYLIAAIGVIKLLVSRKGNTED